MNLDSAAVSLETALSALEVYLRADIPAMLTGAPGVGKTEGVEQTADRLGFACLTESLATMESVDLRGLPAMDGAGGVVWSKPDFLVRLERLKAETGRDIVLFIDEANANSQSVQIPLMQIARKRAVGPHALPAGTRIVMAGNRMADRAAAQRMGTALNNRLGHIEVASPATGEGVKAWCRWAAGAGIHPMVVAFIMLRGASNGIEGRPGHQPGLLHMFNPTDANAAAFPSPRSWAEVSKVADAPDAIRFVNVRGLVGPIGATEFEGFVQVYRKAPPVMAIVSNPAGAPVPTEPGVQYAVSLALARAANPGNFAAILQYMTRVGREFEIVTATDAIRRNPDLTDTPAFIGWAARNADVTI